MGGAIALAPIGAAVHAQEYKAQQAGKVRNGAPREQGSVSTS